MAQVISISNHKGGVGKTTSVVNLGAALHQMGKRVLMVDMDPQANLSQSLGVFEPEKSVYSLLRGFCTIDEAMNELEMDLCLIPSELDLSGAELELSMEAGREFILKDHLEKVGDQFDYILIDCPPSLGLLTINAFTASTQVFFPLQAQFLATQGLKKLLEVIEKVQQRLNRDLQIGGVFITQFDKRKVLNRNVREAIQKHFGDALFNTVIRDNVALAEAPSKQTNIFRYNSKSNGALDYWELAQEVSQRLP
ncbi:AAA family ATPase [Flammeovirga yaeyamensis]|uniref:AAA family ATPase n=2 Tax=Flammeovirga yaeyamensis TaxID=367791 RepID=A0AAX1N1D5_9BACT|nr:MULTISPECIES: AAA family ATPase [Flammeovirga]ANQ51242.1 ParA family protein [Flammeovirga sp. MY04]MBB3698299.1 chromosome partitioning protein [Flammeovirga yaeyamensis]NMF34348.1 ParA family protein [Flammeovirga yaeyamensis]QWG01329.1 AAA family ATPase [Flammeovirga yaeyamensis]